MFLVFHLAGSTCRATNICCGLKKVVAESRARVNFELQSLVLLLVFHQTLNLSRNKFVVMPPSWIHTGQINQSACCISSNRNKNDKLILQGEKRETSPKNVKHGFLYSVFLRLKTFGLSLCRVFRVAD